MCNVSSYIVHSVLEDLLSLFLFFLCQFRIGHRFIVSGLEKDVMSSSDLSSAVDSSNMKSSGLAQSP